MCAEVAPCTSHRAECRHLDIFVQIMSTQLPDYLSMDLVNMVTGLLSRFKETRLGAEWFCHGVLLVQRD